ncbi:transcription factor GTE4-like isoform X2 [Andrographis paniculata]|uniref:transcription factor GTE4-like isoform X2 n=1 Tax=Andrographis paniculata TaxID=175694 RepID=UPI0021E88882|nr:transcription factor GTE4-like isoform X2 [Andrographis paniculata]
MLGGGDEGSKEEEKLLGRKVYSRRSFKGIENSNLSKEQPPLPNPQARVSGFDLASDNFSGLVVKGGFLRQEDKVWISLSMKSKHEALELKRKLEGERETVRSVMRKIEANERQKKGFENQDGDEMLQPRSVKQLNVLVNEHSNMGNDSAEKEKRTPKANKLYRNSEFLLGKDKIPASESNKKLKSNGKKGVGSVPRTDKFPNQVLKSCSALLERLMKHKHGWVFNMPVDAAALGLHDYFEIIKKPMDLSTVKDRLTRNWYKTPMEFAEDVRLTFRNAMTYNPKGQDVYVMAEQLSKMFEDKWTLIEAEYMRDLKLDMDIDVGSPAPLRKSLPQSRAKPKTIDRSESMASSIAPKRKVASVAQGRAPIPKKPKAKEPNKRDMTYEEKQKLSINLQSLPSEKLESVVQIIKKRNPFVSQQDDEIEVDIDSVDTETLWELDRFITNYKKSLSKNKRKAEIVSGLTAGPETKEKVATETPKESRKDVEGVISTPVDVEKQARDKKNQGASQSISSSDSGSSSNSDHESSSVDGSNGGPSPRK